MATIEIDGKTLDVDNGKMIIEAADEAGIYIPRFCYHKKLSVAANCRMCLVEVENNRKTVPACATPISHGMKVLTASPAAKMSQQAVMEFLLINHPLDCPICDQGGECELQDLAMGFGPNESGYKESKRSVESDDLGTLIATEMTRCIQCTRCVRFGDEIAGVSELGGLGRGEAMQIGTYVQHSMRSEVSANIIDLCPVGALTSKPFRFQARAFEMTQHASVAPHDCLGSHVYLHTRRNELMRVVPKEEESVNETWLSDRDRFSYLGLSHPLRAQAPMIKRDGVWETVDWKTALTFSANALGRVLHEHGPEQCAAFASSSSTLEELYLLQKWMRALGVVHLDHRLHQTDFRDEAQSSWPLERALPFAALSEQEAVLLLGCHVHREVPLAGVRLRKASKNGAKIYAMNPVAYPFPFDMTEQCIVSPDEWPMQLASLLLALVEDTASLPEPVLALLVGLKPDATILNMARALREQRSAIVTGALFENHPHAATLRTLLALIVEHSHANVLRLTQGTNSAGADLVGFVPHQGVLGAPLEKTGLDVQVALAAKLKAYVLMGVEPGLDFANPAGARDAMLAADCVVVLSAYQNEAMKAYADVILPIAPYAETSGTYVNVDGRWQTVKGAVPPLGEARPAWKVLRVLANVFHCEGFDQDSSEEVLQEIKARHVHERAHPRFYPESLPFTPQRFVRVGEWPLYRCDAVVRHATALQHAASSDALVIRVHPDTAKTLHLNEFATVSQGNIAITLPLLCDERVARDVVCVPSGFSETADLGHAFAEITIK